MGIALVLTLGLGSAVSTASTAGAATTTETAVIQGTVAESTSLGIRVAHAGDGAARAAAVAVSDPTQLSARAEGSGLSLTASSVAADLWVLPRSGERLSNGVFPAGEPGDRQSAGSVFVSAGVFGGSCIVAPDTPVHVLEVSYGTDGTVSRLAVDVTGTCVDSTTPHELRLRYHSTTPWLGISAPPSVDFGLVPLAEPVERVVPVRVEGTTPVTFGNVTLWLDPSETKRATDMVVVSDTCSGMTFTGGQQCSLRVRASPSSPEPLSAWLVVPDDTALGSTRATTLGVSGWPVSRGTFHPFAVRAFDTRTMGTGQPVAGGTTTDAQLTAYPSAGWCGDVAAAVFSLTVTGAVSNGYVTAYAGSQRPATSSVNVARGETRTNLVTVPLTDGCHPLRLYTSTTAHLVVDWVGYYATATGRYGSQFDLLAPRRVVDTRTSTPLAPSSTSTVALDLGTEFNADVTAVAVNLTAVDAPRKGWLWTWDGWEGAQPTSSLTFAAGKTVAGAAVVETRQVGGRPTFAIHNGSAGATDVLVDVVGVYYANHAAGLRYSPLPPKRLVDTRKRLGAAPLGPRTSAVVAAPTEVVEPDTEALLGNLTAVAPSAKTYLVAWSGGPRPGTSTLNAAAGEVVANATTIPLATLSSGARRFSLYNNAGTTHALVDVTGAWTGYPAASTGGNRAGYARPSLLGATLTRG
jgi:hypothetical protein